MKKLGFIIGAIFICSYLSAVPAPTGVSGLNKVLSASPEHMGRLYFIWGGKVSQNRSNDSISLTSIGRIPLSVPTAYDTSYAAQRGNCVMLDIPFALGFSITNCLEVNINSAFLADAMEDSVTAIADATGSGCVSYGFSDTELGVKFTPTQLPQLFPTELAKKFNVGLYPLLSFPTGAQKTAIPKICGQDTVFGYPCRKSDGGIHRFFTNDGVSYGGKLLISGVLVADPALIAHLNLGYMKYPHGDSKYTYGFGVEGQYQFFSPFIELYGEHRLVPEDENELDDGGIYVTPGLRFETLANSWITIAVDFKISGYDDASWDFSNNLPDNLQRYELNGFGGTPPWRANLIFSHGFNYMKPPAPPSTGTLAGKVMDKEDEKGVKAVVSFPTFDTTITTNEDGSYAITFSAGKTIVSASPIEKGKYKSSEEQTVLITAGEKQILNFRLERKPVEKPAILTGKITDRVSRMLCIANISFPETQISPVVSDTSGIYRVEISAGTYVLKAEKSGYIPWTQPVTCKAGETTILNIELSPAAQMATIAGKVLDYASRAGIGNAKISFPTTQLPDVITDAATGTYKAQIPAGTYTVKIEADKYVPEGVVIVCEPNATLLKDFELFKKEEKIVLHGINFKVNSAEIKPESYPVLNTAAELLKKHPDVRVEISGHASAEGNASRNLTLSQLRAESVRNYLVTAGISADKLTARGYGITQPIADNGTEPGRQQNRRIEFKILSQ
ncbi:MAG: carboxypeptidase regulatory-like domain-containing protein [bacterium]|nr:carboxypeptidase regulatory-like domain-containing protein [bacterium]